MSPAELFPNQIAEKTFLNNKATCDNNTITQFYRKTCWKEKPFTFTVYLMNHIFQTSALFNTW